MMPAVDPRRDARRKRARVAMFINAGAIVASTALGGTRFSGWRWVPWVVGLTLIIVVTAISMNSGGGPRGRLGISGLSGRDRAAGDPFDGPVAYQWHGLVMVSRMMPRPAGRRWLAEAQSALWEIAAAQRPTVVRSYLLSGPRVAAMMWAYEGLRRVRRAGPGPRLRR